MKHLQARKRMLRAEVLKGILLCNVLKYQMTVDKIPCYQEKIAGRQFNIYRILNYTQSSVPHTFNLKLQNGHIAKVKFAYLRRTK